MAFIAIFVAKLLSIAGIGGLISGLFLRKWPHAILSGIVFGVIDTLFLASTRYTGVAPISWIMAILVAVIMALAGWWLRGRKRNH